MIHGIRDLIGDIRQELKLPDILAERCVHAIIETANCRACVDACPKAAWLLDDDALRLDQTACDGCGLCVPSCPEGAILSSHEIIIGHWQESTIALCACEYTRATDTEGVIPCLHAIGLQDILRLQKKGVVEVVVATADCDQCTRSKAMRLADRLDALNHSLQQAGYPGIKMTRSTIMDWQHLRHEISGESAGPQLSRRGFLTGILNSSLQQGLELFTLFRDQQASFIPPGQLLPQSKATTIWPYLPAIDHDLCNGCDACAKLCPHHAIKLEVTDGQACYQIKPRDCSGCTICVDVCDQQAVRLDEWQAQSQQDILLSTIKCSCCGNPFHLPADRTDKTQAMCRICTQKNHNKNLYQVFN